MSHVRVALLGCGAIATAVHLPVLRSLRGVELVAVVATGFST